MRHSKPTVRVCSMSGASSEENLRGIRGFLAISRRPGQESAGGNAVGNSPSQRTNPLGESARADARTVEPARVECATESGRSGDGGQRPHDGGAVDRRRKRRSANDEAGGAGEGLRSLAGACGGHRRASAPRPSSQSISSRIESSVARRQPRVTGLPTVSQLAAAVQGVLAGDRDLRDAERTVGARRHALRAHRARRAARIPGGVVDDLPDAVLAAGRGMRRRSDRDRDLGPRLAGGEVDDVDAVGLAIELEADARVPPPRRVSGAGRRGVGRGARRPSATRARRPRRRSPKPPRRKRPGAVSRIGRRRSIIAFMSFGRGRRGRNNARESAAARRVASSLRARPAHMNFWGTAQSAA
jgi:hypothetical protein